METEKKLRLLAASEKRIAFLASTVDAFMQDFLKQCKGDDRLATIVAAARLAQIGAILCEEYEANCNELVDSKTEERVATQAAESVVKMVNRNGDDCRALIGEECEPDAPSSPDRSLS